MPLPFVVVLAPPISSAQSLPKTHLPIGAQRSTGLDRRPAALLLVEGGDGGPPIVKGLAGSQPARILI